MISKHALRRRAHNDEILKKMRSGESLATIDMEASWFPPRPVIEKDSTAIRMLCASKKKDKVSNN